MVPTEAGTYPIRDRAVRGTTKGTTETTNPQTDTPQTRTGTVPTKADTGQTKTDIMARVTKAKAKVTKAKTRATKAKTRDTKVTTDHTAKGKGPTKGTPHKISTQETIKAGTKVTRATVNDRTPGLVDIKAILRGVEIMLYTLEWLTRLLVK